MLAKRVCHITDVHNRYDGRIFKKECCSLAKAGFEVYLVVCDELPNEDKNGVHIISTGYKPKNRIDRMLKGGKSVLNEAMKINADLYQLHDPELIMIADKLKKTGKKVVFDSHEDVSMQLLDAYYIPLFLRKPVSNIYCFFAKKRIARMDGVISVSPHIVDKLKKWNENAIMITNYPEVQPLSDTNHKIYDRPYVFFAGGVSEQWMHDKIIEAVSGLDGIDYVFAGPAQDSYIEYLKTIQGWEKSTYLGVIAREEVDSWYNGAIAGMTINFCSQLKGTGTLGNNKLFETMACSKPVICTDYPLWKDVVETNNCGICVDPFNIGEIRRAIQLLHKDVAKANEMGINGRKAVEEKYNWDNQSRELVEFYENFFRD